MKLITPLFLCLLFALTTRAQNSQADDISTPEQSPFSIDGGGAQGVISNSVQEVTGKINTSVPVASIGARGISYPVSFNYSGEKVFEQAQFMNKFEAQSILGEVGI